MKKARRKFSRTVAAKIERGDPVTAPGLHVPAAQRASFITKDCIRTE